MKALAIVPEANICEHRDCFYNHRLSDTIAMPIAKGCPLLQDADGSRCFSVTNEMASVSVCDLASQSRVEII